MTSGATPDGRPLLASGDRGGTVRPWDLATGTRRRFPSPVTPVPSFRLLSARAGTGTSFRPQRGGGQYRAALGPHSRHPLENPSAADPAIAISQSPSKPSESFTSCQSTRVCVVQVKAVVNVSSFVTHCTICGDPTRQAKSSRPSAHSPAIELHRLLCNVHDDFSHRDGTGKVC